MSNIVYQCPDIIGYSKNLRYIKNSIAKFTLTDENNRVMELNGQNMVFTVLLYKKETFYDNANSFMKFMYNKFVKTN